MSTGRKLFDTQPLEPPIFGEETEVSAQRVVPLSGGRVKMSGRGRFNLSTWAALLVVLIAIGAGLVAGLALGAYVDHSTAQAPDASLETPADESAADPATPAPSASSAVEPASGELVNSNGVLDDSEFRDSSAPKATRTISGGHNEKTSEKAAKKSASNTAVRENKEERPRRATQAESESTAGQSKKKSDADSDEEKQQRQDERRRERDIKQAERPRRVIESDIDRIQDIFMGPRRKP